MVSSVYSQSVTLKMHKKVYYSKILKEEKTLLF